VIHRFFVVALSKRQTAWRENFNDKFSFEMARNMHEKLHDKSTADHGLKNWRAESNASPVIYVDLPFPLI